MKNEMQEIKNAIYVGICIYNRLRKSIIKIDGKIVSLEEKKDLGLYLGVLHTQNEISNLLLETELKKDTNIGYKKIDEQEYFASYEDHFKDIFTNVNYESLKEYFSSLLKKDIVIKLNREYDIDIEYFIDTKNKQLVKK